MVGVITAVLTGSTAALVAILVSDHSLAAAVTSGRSSRARLIARADAIPGFRLEKSLAEPLARMTTRHHREPAEPGAAQRLASTGTAPGDIAEPQQT